MHVETRHKTPTLRSRRILTGYQLLVIGLVVLSIVLGLAVPFLPELGQLMLIAVIPATAVFILILRNPYLGVFFFFLYSVLRPYDFLPFLRPMRLTMIIEILTLASWVVSLVVARERIRWSWMHTMFLAFVGVIAVTVVTAWNNRFAFDTFQAMAIYFLMFLITSNVVKSVGRIQQLVWLILGIHVFFALKGIMTFVTGQHYIATTGQYTSGEVGGGFIGDENDFAMAINMMVPFAFFGFFYLKGKAKFFSGIMLVTYVLAVISSFSRGGWVGLAAVITYGMFNVRKKLAVFGVILLLGTTAAIFAPAQYWDEVSSVTDTSESTASARLRYWDAGVRMFFDRPIIGVGASNGGIHMPAYVRGFRDANTQWGRAFHGTWIQVLAELGIIGSIIYLIMIVIVFRWVYRIRRLKVPGDTDNLSYYLATSIIGSLIGYFVTATFLSTAYYPQLWTMYMLAMALVFVVDRAVSDQPEQIQQNPVTSEQAP
ncbi:MAG: O-antigen ligase family protein [Candidatus Zixiibacteriota bacterium]|nr:MAG: O-antigen ligase family protein [candidate division Zixibacteria bacterium]